MIFAVIPAYNEALRIGTVVEKVKTHVDRVIVVDDGSSDATGEHARAAGATVLRHFSNCGAGAATMTGLEAAKRMGATIVVTIDADGQHPADQIPELIEPLQREKADVVFANRFASKKMRAGLPPNHIPFIRRIFNGIGNIVTFFSTGRYVQDSQCGFKAFGPRALSEVRLRMSGFEFCTEIVRESVRHKWRIAEVPTRVTYSAYTLAKGQSFSNGVRTAFKILLRSFLR